MSDFEKSLVSFLLSESSLTSLIGQRLYPNIVNQNESEYPSIVYDQISDNEFESAINGSYGLYNDVYQFSIYGITRTQVKQVQTVLITLLKNKKDDNFDSLFELQWTKKMNVFSSYNNNDNWSKLEFAFFYREL